MRLICTRNAADPVEPINDELDKRVQNRLLCITIVRQIIKQTTSPTYKYKKIQFINVKS